MNVVVSLVLQSLLLSQTLKTFLLGCFEVAATCVLEKVVVIAWVGDSSNHRGSGGLMLC